MMLEWSLSKQQMSEEFDGNCTVSTLVEYKFDKATVEL